MQLQHQVPEKVPEGSGSFRCRALRAKPPSGGRGSPCYNGGTNRHRSVSWFWPRCLHGKENKKTPKKKQKNESQIAGEKKTKKNARRRRKMNSVRSLGLTKKEKKRSFGFRELVAGRCALVLRVVLLLGCVLPTSAFPCNVWSDFERTSTCLDVYTGRSECLTEALNGLPVNVTVGRDAMGSRMRIVCEQPSLLLLQKI